MNSFFEIGPWSFLLGVLNISSETVVNSIELPLSVWHILESEIFRFTEEALTGAPFMPKKQQRPYEVHKNLEGPRSQDLVRGWEGQEVVKDIFSSSDSGLATMSPMGTSGTDTTPTSLNDFDLGVNRYGFQYPVFDGDNGDGDDVDDSDDDDDTNIENYDEGNAESVPPVAQTLNREGEIHPHPVRLPRSQGVAFQRLKTFPNH